MTKVEQGARRDLLQDIYSKAESRIDETDKLDYRKMWQNDGQISAIVNLPKLMILSLGFKFDFPEEAEGDEKILDYVKHCLTATAHQGGMLTPIEDVIEDMTFAPFEGARFYELVYKLVEGQVKLTKIASRDNITCYPASDETGDYIGFYQRVQVFSKTIETFIPKQKSLAIIFNENYGGLNGMSMLKAAWYHWDKKHKLYFIAHLASELQTIPTAIVSHDNVDGTILAAVNQAIDERGLNSRITITDNIKVEELGNGGAPKVDIKALIDHHDSKISKSLLTQWIDLGSENSSTGSRSLGGTFVDIYYKFLQGIIRKIENAFNNEVIPNLVDYNYTTDVYPQLKFNPLSTEDKDFLRESFAKLLDKDALDPQTKVSIINKVNADLGIQEVDEDEYVAGQEDKEEEQQKADEEAVKEKEVEKEEKEEKEEEKTVDNSEYVKFAETRQLFPDEKKIDYVKITKVIDDSISATQARLGDVIRNGIGDVRSVLRNVFNTKDVLSLSSLTAASQNQIVDELNKSLKNVYDESKLIATKEVGVEAAQTDSQQRALINLQANTNGKKLLADINSKLINIAKTNISNGAEDEEETEDSITDTIIDFIGTSLPIIIEQNILGIFHQARRKVYSDNEDQIIGYRYSGVMDDKQTEYCRSLDGKAFKIDDPDLVSIWPPNHFNERSIMVPILASEGPVSFELRSPVSFDSMYSFKNVPAFSEVKKEEIAEQFEKLIEKLDETN